MYHTILEDLNFESDSLSMAEDCISMEISDSESIADIDDGGPTYIAPSFTKSSGEEILFLTELFLPAKRERMYNQKLNNNFWHIRKQAKYFSELREYYQELVLLKSEYAKDGLLNSQEDYLNRKAKLIDNNVDKLNELCEVDPRRFEKFEDFDDFVAPSVQMASLEDFVVKRSKRKGKGQRTDVVFPRAKQEVKPFNLIEKEEEEKRTYLQSLFNSVTKRPQVSFEMNKSKTRGKTRLSPGNNTHPYLEPAPLKPVQTQKYFQTLPSVPFLRLKTEPEPYNTFIHDFPSLHSLSTLLFSETTSLDYQHVYSKLSKLFTVPIKLPIEQDSISLSASTQVPIQTNLQDYYSDSSESEESQIGKSLASKPEQELSHCKFAYKFHLSKRSWTSEEFQNFHRPKVKLCKSFSINIDLETFFNQNLKEDPLSYLKFPRKETLTLAAGQFILCEYIEKNPLIMMKMGMASKIYNYYSDMKREDYMGEVGTLADLKDLQSIRILDNGANLAFIENNLFTAPIFYHQATGSDFLIVKTHDGWIGRNFSKVFTIGQLEPKVEVMAPKSKNFRDFKDKHLISAIFEELYVNGNELSNDRFKDIVQEMKYYNPKKIVNDFKVVKKDGIWTCEKQVLKENFRKIIKPEEFVAFETALFGVQKLQDLGIGLKNIEKVFSAVQILKKEISDQKVGFVAGFIEENVALSPWNLTSCYLKGRKKVNFDLRGRGDPTCGHCGYSFELLSRFTNSDLSLIKDQIRKTVSKEIFLLGNSWYKYLHSADSDSECQLPDINYSSFTNQLSQNLETTATPEAEQEHLQKFIQKISSFQNPAPATKRLIKRTLIIPLLPSGYKKIIQYIDDPEKVENFVPKKFSTPKFFIKSSKTEKDEKNLKKFEEKMKKKEEIRIKKQEEALKRKEERRIEKENKRLMREQEWKTICMEKYKAGAVLFNTGTNANLRCSRCNMIGHVKSNKRVCPAYVEEKVDLEVESKIRLNIADIPEENKKEKKKGKEKKQKSRELQIKTQNSQNASNSRQRRRGIDLFEACLVRFIEHEKDKEIIKKPGGLMELLGKSEKGYKWSFEEFDAAIQGVYGEDYEFFKDDLEELKAKFEFKALPPPPPPPVQKKQKSKAKVQLIEDSETLIINTF